MKIQEILVYKQIQTEKGCIAQQVEQSAFNQLVVGSSPTIPI